MSWQSPAIPYYTADGKFIVLGIDPGLSGALAFFCPADQTVTCFDMPRVQDEIDAHALSRTIMKYAPTIALVERVGPMPRDGVMQAWRFSAANAVVKTVCSLLNVPVTLVPASVWKKEMKLPGGREGKEKSRLRALQLFPKCADQFARKKDSGRAEAALIAHFAAQKFIINRTVP